MKRGLMAFMVLVIPSAGFAATPCDQQIKAETPSPVEMAFIMCSRTAHHDEPACDFIKERYQESGIEAARAKAEAAELERRINCEQDYIADFSKKAGGPAPAKRSIDTYLNPMGGAAKHTH